MIKKFSEMLNEASSLSTLETIIDINNEQKSLFNLMKFENALDKKNEDNEDINKMRRGWLATSLCGSANSELALIFMAGGDSIGFLKNVKFNSIESVPMIIKAFHIRLAKLRK